MKNSVIKSILLICTSIFLIIGLIGLSQIGIVATTQLRERAAASAAVLLIYAAAFLISFILSLIFLREK